MKKYYFLVGLFLVCIQMLTAQCPGWLMVDSQSDIDSFLLEYPNCTELPKIYLDDLALDNLNGLINIETITGDVFINDIAGLVNLDGLQNLSYIGGNLKINHNPDLSSISALASLETLVGDLDIKENPTLTTIDGLEGLTTVSSIDIAWNEALASLDGLQNISSVTGAVRISYAWPVSTLAPLANLTSVGSLFLGYLPLVTDLQGLHNLENIHSGGLSLSSLGIANLEDLNIDTIGGGVSITNCDNLISLSALSDVTWSAGSLFTEVHIFANELLINLDGLEGITGLNTIWIIDNPLLSSIASLNNAVVSDAIIIEQNPTLNSCAIYPVCAFNGTGTFSIIDNGANCLDEATVMADCINNSSSAAGTTFLDLDCDAVYGVEDFPLSNFIIFRNPDGLPFAASNEDGAYFGFLPNEVTWTLYPQPISGFTVLPEEHTITTGATASFFTGLDFGYCPDSVFVDYLVDITAFVPAVPGFIQSYEICVQNLGTLPALFPFTLTFDFLGLSSSDYVTILNPDGGLVSGSSINWEVNEMGLFEQLCFTILVEIDPGTPLGTIIEPYAILTLPTGIDDLDPTNNWDRLLQEVVGSYDPNDKSYYPEDYNLLHYQNGEALEYLIRFQNTGTYPATFIEVLDTIAANLDLSTFRMISASHDYTLTFPAERVLKWRFNNINLPDSTSNEPESHGFIKFSIEPVEGLALNEAISNRCGIYFDFNEPVITNYATTVLAEPTGVFSSERNSLAFELFPNPTRNRVTIQTEQDLGPAQILLYDHKGRLIQIHHKNLGKQQTELTLHNIPQGFYLLKIITGDAIGVRKLVVE